MAALAELKVGEVEALSRKELKENLIVLLVLLSLELIGYFLLVWLGVDS